MPRLICAQILLVGCYLWTCVPACVLWWLGHNSYSCLDLLALVWLWFGGCPCGNRRWWCDWRSWSIVFKWQCIHIWPWWCTSQWCHPHSSLTYTLKILIEATVLPWVWIFFGVCLHYLSLLLFLFLSVLCYLQMVDLDLPRTLSTLHMRYFKCT